MENLPREESLSGRGPRSHRTEAPSRTFRSKDTAQSEHLLKDFLKENSRLSKDESSVVKNWRSVAIGIPFPVKTTSTAIILSGTGDTF